MVNIYDVQQNELTEKAAQELKKVSEIKPPSWASFVKTGASKDRPPMKRDWWYIRTASVLKNLYKQGPIGVSKLRKKYGGKKNRGYKPEKFYGASGNILRKILQQLEKAGFAKKADKGVHKGRVITPKGASFLDKIASNIAGPRKKPAKAAKQEVKETTEENPKLPEHKPAKAAKQEVKETTEEKPKPTEHNPHDKK